ncbi:hypothetical protein [Streptomyces sp. CA-179760]|uniref:MmyB family transcriptional regulator n=1 Tax=Streptomyces sp. CA-179760 TaxID=3240054 RepID=UPI003D920858
MTTGSAMSLSDSDFATPIGERYFEDYVPGAVYDGSAIMTREDIWVRLIFTDPRMREVHADWEDVARQAVAQLRMEAAANSGSARLAALVGELAERASVSSCRRTIPTSCPADYEIHPAHQEPSETAWSCGTTSARSMSSKARPKTRGVFSSKKWTVSAFASAMAPGRGSRPCA